jgi:hypothetical protein
MCLTQEKAPVLYNAASDIYLEDQKNAMKPKLLKYSHYSSPISNFGLCLSIDQNIFESHAPFYEECVSI